MTGSKQAFVLAVALQKGGVGKTTTALNVAVEVSRRGYRVLLVDLDQQANATQGLGIAPADAEFTMYEVLHEDRAERVPLSRAIVPSPHGPDVAPAHLALRKLERTGLGAGGQLRLAREVDALTDYDLVVIDCPPSLGELTISAIAAADTILATVSPGSDELAALEELQKTVEDVRDGYNSTVGIGFILATNFDARTQLGKDVRRILQRDWEKEYLGEISSTVRVGEAKARQLPISDYAPDSPAAHDYQAVTRRILERTGL